MGVSKQPLLWLLGVGLVVSGCPGGSSDTTGVASATTTTASSSSTGTTSTTSTTTTGTASTTTMTETEGCEFLLCGDMPPSANECDQWEQDCPEGFKCNAWIDDGGSAWNAHKCVPVDPDPDQVGDPCTVVDGVGSGVDSCDLGAMCWEVDFETNEGVCIEFCGGSIEERICPPGFFCQVWAAAVLTFCVENCDPLLQDCPNDDLCIPSGEHFICALDASGDAGLYGDPCEHSNACKPGLYCLNPEYVEGCQAAGCCTPFCDTSKPLMCPGATQECIPWYEEGKEPPGYEDLGICGIPQ